MVAKRQFDIAELLCSFGANIADITNEYSYASGFVGATKMTYKTQGVSEVDLQRWQVRVIDY